MRIAMADGGLHLLNVGVINEVMPDLDRGRQVADPTHGAPITPTASPNSASSALSKDSAPNIAQVRLSQTRTVSFGISASPSFTTSKWA